MQKLLLVLSEECPWCQQFREETLPNEKVKLALLGFAWKIVEPGDPALSNYNIGGIPAFLLLNADGSVKSQHEGFLDATDFCTWLAGGHVPDDLAKTTRCP